MKVLFLSMALIFTHAAFAGDPTECWSQSSYKGIVADTSRMEVSTANTFSSSVELRHSGQPDKFDFIAKKDGNYFTLEILKNGEVLGANSLEMPYSFKESDLMVKDGFYKHYILCK